MASRTWILLCCVLLPACLYGQDDVLGSQEGDCGCASISNQLARLTSRANEVDRQITVLMQGNTDLAKQITDVRQVNSGIDREIARLNHNSSILDGRAIVLRQNYKVKEEEISGLMRNDQAGEGKVALLRRNAKAREEDLADLKHKHEVKGEEIQGLKEADQRFDKSLSESESNNTAFTAGLAELNSKRQAIEEGINQLDRSININEEDINVLEKNYKTRGVEINGLKKNDEYQDDEIVGLKHADQLQAEIVNDLSQKFQATEAKVNVLIQADVTFGSQISSIQVTDKEIDGLLAVVVRTDGAEKAKLLVLRQNDKDNDEIAAGLSHNDTVIQRGIDSFKGSYKAITGEISRLTARHTSVNVDLTVLGQTDVILQDKLSSMSQKYSLMEQEVLLLEQQNADYMSRISSLSRDITTIQIFINTTRVTTETMTTTTMKQTLCARGMQQDQPRVPILLWGSVPALCDTVTNGGGYIVIERRTTGDENFNRGWVDYKKGFGTTATDYYLGNQYIHKLTSEGYTRARIDLIIEGKSYYAEYSHFSVGDEASYYKLTVSGYSGTAGDSLKDDDGMCFSTYDQDHDNSSDNCAANRRGGFWFSTCGSANLNGLFGKTGEDAAAWSSVSASVSSLEIKLYLEK